MSRSPELVDTFRLPVDFGELGFAWFLFLLLLLPSGLAIHSLGAGIAIIPSLIWLALVTYAIVMLLWEAAASDCPPASLAALLPFHELELRRDESGRSELWEVTHLVLGRVVRSRCDLARLETLRWSKGQASARVGRDMDDWSVTLWFSPPESPRTEFERTIGQGTRFGPSSPLEDAEVLAERIADWLIGHGLPLERCKGEDQYTVVAADQAATNRALSSVDQVGPVSAVFVAPGASSARRSEARAQIS